MKPTTENGIFTATDVSIWIQRGDIKYNDKLILLSEHNCQIDALKCIVLENQKH